MIFASRIEIPAFISRSGSPSLKMWCAVSLILVSKSSDLSGRDLEERGEKLNSLSILRMAGSKQSYKMFVDRCP